jgi:hypothetical protein
MPKQRVFGGYARDEDGKQTRTVHIPGGNTHVGTQTFVTTPTGHNEAWLFTRPDKKSLRRDNAQSTRNARTKAKRKNETGMRARVSLALRAESLGAGSAEGMKPKALSQVVLRAEQSAEERDARNATEIDRQKDCRAGQSVDVRGALNAARRAHDKVRRAEQPPQDRDANTARRANEQVTRSMRWHCAPCTPVRLVFRVFPTNPY